MQGYFRTFRESIRNFGCDDPVRALLAIRAGATRIVEAGVISFRAPGIQARISQNNDTGLHYPSRPIYPAMTIRVKRYVVLLLLVAAAGAAVYFYRTPEIKEEPSQLHESPPVKPSPATKASPAPKANSGEASMRGLNPIMILVEELPPAAAGCGISRDALRVAAELPLSQSPLRIVKTVATTKAYLYIQVNVISVQNTCVGNVYVSFRTGSVIESNNQLAIASIWNENVIGAAWPNDAPGEINKAVDTLTKKFIEEWTRDNR